MLQTYLSPSEGYNVRPFLVAPFVSLLEQAWSSKVNSKMARALY